MGIAPRAGIKMQVTRYPLAQANTALNDLRAGHFEGAAVPYLLHTPFDIQLKEVPMNEASTLMRTAEGMKLAISSARDAQYVPGRRQFFQYRDLGVTEATGGKMRAQVTSASRPRIARPGGTTTRATCSSSTFSRLGRSRIRGWSKSAVRRRR